MSFSGALTLTDLNDFITPSQACIKPVEEVKSVERVQEPGAAATQIHIDSSGGYYEVSSSGQTARTKLQTAEISLNDCLACSGCITSAEAVLISIQSHTEVLSFLSSNPPPSSPDHAIPVLSISPQSLASLAASISPPPSSSPSIPLHRILARIRAFAAEKLGIEHVFDTTFARHIALREHVAEFHERKSAPNASETLPMLAGACPGWVCYAEKAHPEMLPFISRTKSPQQIMGSMIKHYMGSKLGKLPDKMYHITVMPCYDKKLEASRSDFYNEAYSTRDVDIVLTTGELQRLMLESSFSLSDPVPNEDSLAPPNLLGVPDLLTPPGSSSGSYLQSLIHSLSSSIPSPVVTSKRIRSDYEEYILRNGDTGELVFKGATCFGFRNLQNLVRKVGRSHGLGAGRGAAAAGRMSSRASGSASSGVSLRAIARRRKAAAAADPSATATGETSSSLEAEEKEASRGYDYVEVMACPGGCVNGGGQLKAPTPSSSSTTTIDEEGFTRSWADSGVSLPATPLTPSSSSSEPNMLASERWGDKEWIKRVEAAYWNTHGLITPPPSPPASVSSLAPSISSAQPSPSAVLATTSDEMEKADQLAELVVRKMRELVTSEADGRGVEMGEDLLRTSYRAVVSEVVGLAVKW